jgi:hypothetical protein
VAANLDSYADIIMVVFEKVAQAYEDKDNPFGLAEAMGNIIQGLDADTCAEIIGMTKYTSECCYQDGCHDLAHWRDSDNQLWCDEHRHSLTAPWKGTNLLLSDHADLMHKFGPHAQQVTDFVTQHQDNKQFVELARIAHNLKVKICQKLTS